MHNCAWYEAILPTVITFYAFERLGQKLYKLSLKPISDRSKLYKQ